MRLAPLRARRAIGTAYVDVFRAIPVLTLLFIAYFGLAEVGMRLDPVPVAVLGFGINLGGLEGADRHWPKGAIEASVSQQNVVALR